ncbi:MAG TPA: cytochrome c peroxidase [Steroidobacteraceae bacterium]
MKPPLKAALAAVCASFIFFTLAAEPPLGLPPVPVPAANPPTPEKVRLGEKLFNDQRFSSTGEVSCASCHDPNRAFTDSPFVTSEGINKLTGTRNAPSIINAAYYGSLFWDGRSPTLEDQVRHPFVNPVEMGLPDHGPVLEVVRSDPEYLVLFRAAFQKEPSQITMLEVQQAIASFERTVVSGDSAFDRWYFGGVEDAISEQAKRGFDVFRNRGRCVTCHLIEQDQALFTDNRFHNNGAGRIQEAGAKLARTFLEAKARGASVDKAVLASPTFSELGRFVVTEAPGDLGAFKTPTLRNVAVTAPYMHDGSLETLRAVVEHYNNGGVARKGDSASEFLSDEIRPLDLTEEEITALIAFLQTLTSPQFIR